MATYEEEKWKLLTFFGVSVEFFDFWVVHNFEKKNSQILTANLTHESTSQGVSAKPSL